MASPFQQRSLQRKLIYLGMILVLFTGSYLFMHHRTFAIPVLGWEVKSVITQAEDLALREQNIGEVELTGAAVRLNLTGLRGLAVCALWNTAMEKQKKNQWNELELIVRSLTKLQPHFITPWLFQSWNLAYNVSVESDREADQYFYITRGIELLAEGERQNRHHPDLRFAIGFYNQNKICQSDQTVVLRSLYQLSCIPPNERDPARFRRDDGTGETTIDLAELEDFCKTHPQLVRRLRDVVNGLKMNKPELIVQFLDENYSVPTMYEDTKKAVAGGWKRTPDKLLPMIDRFPILPPEHEAPPPQTLFRLPDREEITAEDTKSIGRDDFNAWICARAWFGFAQEPLPPTGEYPGIDAPISDPTKQRRPKFTTAIFRNYPARAQTYVAESLEKEGWFDRKGWHITDWFSRERYPDGLVVGADSDYAKDAWTRASKMWEEHGIRDKLYLTPREEENLKQEAQFYKNEYIGEAIRSPVPLDLSRENQRTPEERERMEKSYRSYSYGYWYNHYRNLTNFARFYQGAQTEMDEMTIAARKAFFEARQLNRQARQAEALERYEAPLAPGMPGALMYWRELLVNERFGADDNQTEDDSYIVQLRYLKLLKEMRGQELGQAGAIQALLSESAVGATPSWLTLARLLRPNLTPQPEITGPFDGQTKRGTEIISQQTRDSVHSRFGIGVKRPTGPLQPMPSSPPAAGQ